jgi:hypothetical protein
MTEELANAWIHMALWLWVLVSRGTNHNKYRCSSGVTECGSTVAQVDLETQDETHRCILVRAIGPYIQWWWFFVFESTQIGGYNESVRDLEGMRSYGLSVVRLLPRRWRRQTRGRSARLLLSGLLCSRCRAWWSLASSILFSFDLHPL